MNKAKTVFSTFFISLLFISCVHTPPATDSVMEFDDGIKVLACNIAGQIDNSSIANILGKVVIDPITGKKSLKRIVIDPFTDVESGYPVKVTTRIVTIFSAEFQKRFFDLTGTLEPDNLVISDYVLNGMVTLVERQGGQGKVYKVYATVFDRSSGKVLAAAAVHVRNFNTTPMDIYTDSPIFLKGKNYRDYTASVMKSPDENVVEDYHNRLMLKSMQVKGDALYENKEYNKSLTYYNQAAAGMSDNQLEFLNGQFTNLVKQYKWEDAEKVYGKLIRVSVAETREISSKITFAPNSIMPTEKKEMLNKIYLRQIAKLVASSPGCRVKIIGHCSKTGRGDYNDKLSLQRALSIEKLLASYEPNVSRKSESFGRGFRENIAGTGRDDMTDQIDRRVEFKFDGCL